MTSKIGKIEFIAIVRHLAWCSYQVAAGQEYNEEINDDQMHSLINGVHFLLEHPDVAPEVNHNNWLKQKKIQGWKYGKVKDFVLKTHPDLVPFDQLPDIEKRKDISDALSHRLALKLWEKL